MSMTTKAWIFAVVVAGGFLVIHISLVAGGA